MAEMRNRYQNLVEKASAKGISFYTYSQMR